VDVTATLDAPHPPGVVFPWVADLALYPSWLGMVVRAEPAPEPETWVVDLRGRLGPLSRSKRLRMVRTGIEEDRSVRFERDERDGREHSPWVLDATVEAAPGGTRLDVRLHYGGSLFGPMLEKVLATEIERSRTRLLACIEDDG
jgi:hypothetical protein